MPSILQHLHLGPRKKRVTGAEKVNDVNTQVDFSNKSILITGGAGFIGSNLAFYIQQNFPSAHVVVFDIFRSDERLSNGNLKSFGSYANLIGFEGTIICGDLKNSCDLSALDKFDFDYIFHQAAISDTRVYDQELILRTNINSFYTILEIARQSGAVLVYASSAAQYGNSPAPQHVGIESPNNPYGYSKYAMDQIAMRFAADNQSSKVIGLRYFNVYGPNEFYKESTASMVLKLALQILGESRPKLFAGSDKIFRDFVYVDDVVRANVISCKASKSGIYNIGTGVSSSFQDIANILLAELASNINIEYIENPYSDYQYDTRADVLQSKKSLGFESEFSLESGIKAYLPSIVDLFERGVYSSKA